MSTRIKETRKQLLAKLEQAESQIANLHGKVNGLSSDLTEANKTLKRLTPFAIETQDVPHERCKEIRFRIDDTMIAMGHEREAFEEAAYRICRTLGTNVLERVLGFDRDMWQMHNFFYAMHLCSRMGVEVMMQSSDSSSTTSGVGSCHIRAFDNRMGEFIYNQKSEDFAKLINEFSQLCIKGDMFR